MHFTPLDIDARMIAAESTLRRLPEPMLRGFGSGWPDVVRDSVESYGYTPTKVRAAPSARDISAMQEAMQWLLWIAPIERRIVWGMAELRPIERLARANGMSQADAGLAWQAGLIAIAHRLNAIHCRRYGHPPGSLETLSARNPISPSGLA